jgi:tripartite-type tricarboxylate transporter receptor subunit TctC
LDNVSRVIAERLSTQLGQPMILDDRGGAAGKEKRKPHFTGC